MFFAMSKETRRDQKSALEEENRVSEALLKLSVLCSRESQRLQAIKTSWTSKIRAQGNSLFNPRSGIGLGTVFLLNFSVSFVR